MSRRSRWEELTDSIDGSAGIDGTASIDGSVSIDGYIGITCPSELPLGRRRWYYIFDHSHQSLLLIDTGHHKSHSQVPRREKTVFSA